MVMLLTGWDGKMGEDSVAASVYQFHQMFAAKSMHGVWSDNPDRCKLWNDEYRYFAFEAFARMLILANEGNYTYNILC